jgi:putative Holliday junction resolvase
VRVLALDYGAARTGVAVCDATGTVARPLTVVERAGTPQGLQRVVAVVAEQRPELIVVGLPVSLDGAEHAQAREVRGFIAKLGQALDVPVVTYDERFTTTIARQKGGRRPLDARAAAQILQEYLDSHELGTTRP